MTRKHQYLLLNFGLAIFILVFINILHFNSNNSNWGLMTTIFKNHDSDRLISTSKLPKNLTKGIKRILFWTEFFGDNDLNSLDLGSAGKDEQLQYCNYGCEFTTNKALIGSSDAVLFHGRDLGSYGGEGQGLPELIFIPNQLPAKRNSSQYWIFYLFESPVHTFVPLDTFNNLFNITMTYRTDSDIYIPYQRLIKVIHKERQNGSQYRQLLQKKTKKVAWIVSNCESPSKRELLVKELRKHIQVDIFGSCGENTCSSDNVDDRDVFRPWSCYEEIGKYYKFYLSFENTLCADYVTEKFFGALATGMVPIVYGGANYSQHAPQGSYINARSFPSMKSLANYLLKLDKNDQLYLKYFQWKEHFRVEKVNVLQRAWCTLCRKLSTGEMPFRKKRTIGNLKSWWLRHGNSNVCKKPHIPEF